MVKIISINGVNYIKESDIKQTAEKLDGMKYVIIRTQNAGVFSGYLKEKTGETVILKQARRLWYWSGACSLSQLAMEGMVKELIGKHNAHILNQFQLQGLGDEKILYKVLEKAGDETKVFFGINLEEPNK